MTSLTVALEALEKDAQVWDDVASTLSSASWNASALTLSSMSLSQVGADVGLVETYEAVRARVERLLREGDNELGVIAATLRQVKKAYESQDEAERAALSGMWDPKQ